MRAELFPADLEIAPDGVLQSAGGPAFGIFDLVRRAICHLVYLSLLEIILEFLN